TPGTPDAARPAERVVQHADLRSHGTEFVGHRVDLPASWSGWRPNPDLCGDRNDGGGSDRHVGRAIAAQLRRPQASDPRRASRPSAVAGPDPPSDPCRRGPPTAGHVVAASRRYRLAVDRAELPTVGAETHPPRLRRGSTGCG